VAPRWSDTEWRTARAVATIHGVSGVLAGSLRWEGPQGWREFLAEQRQVTSERLPRIQELLQALHAQACERGLALIALKGASLHARGIYQPGERPMADVDLLVDAAHVEQASTLITDLGFIPGPVTWKHRAFEPREREAQVGGFGETSSNPLKIELHTRLREILPVRAVDVSAAAFAAEPAPGVHDYPSRAALLLHLLLHAAGALSGRTARLIHLQDIARLTQRMGTAEWQELFTQARATSDPTLWWAFPALVLTDRYFHCVPGPVLARLAAACRWPLRRVYRRRRLADVSLSFLWISAFPGFEWARSPAELLSYVSARIYPSAETLRLREEFARSQPLVSGGRWAYTPQARRVARWLLARQPRQETLQPLRVSLLQPWGRLA
jgi:Uncharacterised nucleotidyltransferase